jgi:hypothetical protein
LTFGLSGLIFSSGSIAPVIHGIEPSIGLVRSDSSAFLGKPVLHHDLIKDLSARDAPPPEKVLADPVELLVNHHSAASMAPHVNLPDQEWISFLQV